MKNSREFSPGLTIKCDIDTKLTVRGDAQRLRQVFWNLLINGCQAMPSGGAISVAATPFSHIEDDSVWCEVVIEDCGQGISKEDTAKIFDPFFTTKTGGTGLGLAIVYRIIEDHGGTISVEGNEGKGARFHVRMPMFGENTRANNVNRSFADSFRKR